jgi:type IV pilus assembly protein PilB
MTEEQLEVALAEHLSSGKRLGQVLVERGYVTEDELRQLLEAQQNGNRGIDLLKTSVAEAEAELEPEPSAEEESGPGHVLFVWSPSGYTLLARAGDPPAVGSEVGVTGGSLVVAKIGPSPLPGDPRPCAFLDAP